ncbi:MAG: DNA-directed RNA polymerase subunit alpha [Patescibacteria group bacterium]
MEKIPLPKKLGITPVADHQATFTIEPCYPGYGTTLGNALRRVLLSSLEGGAITAVKIKGVNHEFSTLPNVKEDVVEIILNLKAIRLQVNTDEPQTVTIKAKGEKKVTGKDIKCPTGVEVFTTDQIIATLTDKSAEFEAELRVEKGRGYIPVENREKEKNEIGMIAIDAVYTPIRNVNFEVDSVRVGQMTNFDKLVLDITTDGTISPVEAFTQATQILEDHFQFILGAAKEEHATEEPAEKEKEKEEKAAEPKKKRGRPKKTEAKEE